MAGDTPGRECPHKDLGMRPQIGTEKLSGGTVSDADTGSPYGRGVLPFSGVAGRSLPVDVTVAPVLPVEGTASVGSRAGCSGAGRWDHSGGHFRTEVSS